MIRYKQMSLSGASGSLTIQPIAGVLDFVRVTYTNGQAGGDLTLTDDQTGMALLTLTNHNTNFAAPIRKQSVDQAGAAITDDYGRIPMTGSVTLTTAQQASNTTVLVELWWIE